MLPPSRNTRTPEVDYRELAGGPSKKIKRQEKGKEVAREAGDFESMDPLNAEANQLRATSSKGESLKTQSQKGQAYQETST
ncbi:hypothetical protein KEM55_002444, partial [Ascosphaera atra]